MGSWVSDAKERARAVLTRDRRGGADPALPAADSAPSGRLDEHRRVLQEHDRRLTELHHLAARIERRLEGQNRDVAMLHDVLATTAIVDALPPDDTLVTVVLPTRDRPGWLQEAIASVLTQTHPAFELLVYDDGSEPAATVPDDPRIRLVRGDGSRGGSVARNALLAQARGSLVAYLDDDNLMGRHWLRAVVWAFAAHPEADVVYGALAIEPAAAGDGRPLLRLLPWDPRRHRAEGLIDQNVLAHRASVSARLDAAFEVASDWELVDRLTRSADPVRVPVVAAAYRRRGVPDRVSDRADAYAARAATQRAILRRAPFRVLGVGVAVPPGVAAVAERCEEPALHAAVARLDPHLVLLPDPDAAERLAATLDDLWLPYGVVAGGRPPTPDHPLRLAPWDGDPESLPALLDDALARAAGFVPG